MGTVAEVRVSGFHDPAPALDAAFAALDLVDTRMSLWRESELARLNREGFADCSPELAAVVRHALGVAADSRGAFDPTVEPLVRAAGHLGGEVRAPTEKQRAALLTRVGWTRVHLAPGTRMVRLTGRARLDLGGIAKGYAVDLALEALRQAGATAGLVDLGGSSVGVFGTEIGVDVRDPSGEHALPWASFVLGDASLGSSASEERKGHIIDPRTGRPAARVASATVVAGSAMEADALSTAVFVLGAEEGLALLARRGADGIVLLREEGRPVIRTTPGFATSFRLVTAPGVTVR